MSADEGSEKPDRIQKIIENTVKSTRVGDERGIKMFILEFFGKSEGDKYFSKHLEQAARFRWFADEREQKKS